MRSLVIWLLLAVAVAEFVDEPSEPGAWVEEEDVDESFDEDHEVYSRQRRSPDDGYEYVRVKRCCEEPVRMRRSSDYVRAPRQVHQYEVHEFTEEHEPSSPPYEEMLAAASDHYHRVYASPGAPKTARYLNPDVSSTVNVAQNVNPSYASVNHEPSVSSVSSPSYHAQPAPFSHPTQSVSPAQFAVPVSSVFVPAEVPTVPVVPAVPLQQLADQAPAAAGHLHHKQGHAHGHGHGHVQGGGHGQIAKHHAHNGGKTVKGFNQDHYVDKGGKGHKTDELHKKEYEEAAGHKKKHHDRAGHKGSHEEEAHGQRGAHFDEKKGHKKGHKTKGYHNKYHKDEFHKEHKFYDDYHKSGEHHRYGKFNAKHASNESGKKKAHHVNAGHDFVERGKKGYSNKGHVDADHKGYDGKKGHDEHHEHHSSHGKKGGKEGGSHWGYAKKN